MKILQISFHTAPFGSAGKYDSGGLNIYVEKISDQLSKNNHVTVVTGEKAESFIKENLEFKSLNLFDKDLSVEDKEIYLQEFINKLYESVDPESFDVIHAHYWLSGLVGKEIANKYNKPLVYTSHSLGIFLDGYNKERVDCEKIIMTSSDVITTSSLFEEDMILKNYNVDSNKMKQITPGVDVEIFSPDSTVKKRKYILIDRKNSGTKRTNETIKFLDNFRKVENNFTCYFVGGPSGKSGNEYLEELKKTVVDLNLESHVEFLDNLPQTEIRDLLNKSKLLIHTSKFETFGLVAAEANAMGVPVLTTNSGSVLEIVESNDNGYYSESLIDGNVNNFVKELLNNNDKFHEIMLNCLDKSKAYSWANTAREIEILYKDFA